MRVSTELVDARSDNTIWADSYDRDLTDIFAIQSEVAQTIAAKLAATLSPQEKQNIEKKPTENLEAYDLYLRAKELLVNVRISSTEDVRKPLAGAIALLDRAIDVDQKFTLAYCRLAEAHDLLYYLYDHTREQRNLADAAISRALASEPDLPEVQLIYAEHLYYAFRDYERAREHLAIAKSDLPNDTEAIALGAFMDRRQGHWEKAIQEFKDALERDPGNSVSVENLALTLECTRQFRAAEQMFDRLIALRPDLAILKTQKPLVIYRETGDDAAIRAAIAAFPGSISDDRGVLSLRLSFAFVDRDWAQAKELIEKLDGGDDQGDFA
ncbi:MAG: hypothetical protein QOI53_3212, partial [Verrucomicrobiota bacterium]|nr:hypothetical protein [Verrucomicrobiota bacterium]